MCGVCLCLCVWCVCVCVCLCDGVCVSVCKSYRVSFLGESRNAPSPVRGKFRCRVIITHTVCTV